MGQKKQRLLEAERHPSPPDRAQTLAPLEPCLGPPAALSPQRSIYFSSPKSHSAQLGSEFFDQPAVPLARAFLGQVLSRSQGIGGKASGRGRRSSLAHSALHRPALVPCGLDCSPRCPADLSPCPVLSWPFCPLGPHPCPGCCLGHLQLAPLPAGLPALTRSWWHWLHPGPWSRPGPLRGSWSCCSGLSEPGAWELRRTVLCGQSRWKASWAAVWGQHWHPVPSMLPCPRLSI